MATQPTPTTPNPDAGAPLPTAANALQPNQPVKPLGEPVKLKGKKLVPVQTVVLYRKNKETGENEQVVPKIGEPFEFTHEELVSISKSNPAALSAKATVDADQVDDGNV